MAARHDARIIEPYPNQNIAAKTFDDRHAFAARA